MGSGPNSPNIPMPRSPNHRRSPNQRLKILRTWTQVRTPDAADLAPKPKKPEGYVDHPPPHSQCGSLQMVTGTSPASFGWAIQKHSARLSAGLCGLLSYRVTVKTVKP